MSFLNSFTENVRNYPNKIALEFIDPPLQRLTYAELDEQVNRTAAYLQSLGLQPGDRVALIGRPDELASASVLLTFVVNGPEASDEIHSG